MKKTTNNNDNDRKTGQQANQETWTQNFLGSNSTWLFNRRALTALVGKVVGNMAPTFDNNQSRKQDEITKIRHGKNTKQKKLTSSKKKKN